VPLGRKNGGIDVTNLQDHTSTIHKDMIEGKSLRKEKNLRSQGKKEWSRGHLAPREGGMEDTLWGQEEKGRRYTKKKKQNLN